MMREILNSGLFWGFAAGVFAAGFGFISLYYENRQERKVGIAQLS